MQSLPRDVLLLILRQCPNARAVCRAWAALLPARPATDAFVFRATLPALVWTVPLLCAITWGVDDVGAEQQLDSLVDWSSAHHALAVLSTADRWRVRVRAWSALESLPHIDEAFLPCLVRVARPAEGAAWLAKRIALASTPVRRACFWNADARGLHALAQRWRDEFAPPGLVAAYQVARTAVTEASPVTIDVCSSEMRGKLESLGVPLLLVEKTYIKLARPATVHVAWADGRAEHVVTRHSRRLAAASCFLLVVQRVLASVCDVTWVEAHSITSAACAVVTQVADTQRVSQLRRLMDFTAHIDPLWVINTIAGTPDAVAPDSEVVRRLCGSLVGQAWVNMLMNLGHSGNMLITSKGQVVLVDYTFAWKPRAWRFGVRRDRSAFCLPLELVRPLKAFGAWTTFKETFVAAALCVRQVRENLVPSHAILASHLASILQELGPPGGRRTSLWWSPRR